MEHRLSKGVFFFPLGSPHALLVVWPHVKCHRAQSEVSGLAASTRHVPAMNLPGTPP